MRVVAYRLRRVLRASRRATLAMTLIVTIVVAVVLAIAAGASRTSTAPDRFSEASGIKADAEVQQQGGAPRTAEVRRLPSVDSASAITFIFGAQRPLANSRKSTGDAIVFAGSISAAGERLVAGRNPQEGHDGEFVTTKTVVESQHLRLGDRFQLLTLTNEQAAANGFTLAKPSDAKGPRLTTRLVGVVDGPSQLDDPSPVAFFPLSLLKRHPGTSATVMRVVLRPGHSLSEFKGELDGLKNSDVFTVQKAQLVSAEIRTAVKGQSEGLWIVAVVAAVAAVVAIGQLLIRQVRLSGREQSTLEAMGLSRGQTTLEMVGHAAVPIIAGGLLGGVVATFPSAIFPFGFVRRIEPAPGFRVETTVLVVGALVLVVSLFVSVTLAFALSFRSPRVAGPPTAPLIARRLTGPVSTGARFAFSRESGERTTIRGAMVGMVVGIACLVGAFAFGASLDLILDQPARWGANYDVAIGGNGAKQLPAGILRRVTNDRTAAAITFYGTGQTRVGRTSLQLVGMQTVRGELVPPVLEGRLPAGADELALGRLTAQSLHARVGSRLLLTSRGRTFPFRVTGLIVVPSVDGVDGVGQDGLVTLDGLAGLRGVPASRAADALVANVRGSASPEHRVALFRRLGGDGGTAAQIEAGQTVFGPPSAIVNVKRIRVVPYLLGGVLSLLVLVTLSHVVITSMHRRRRDIAILRALGGDRRWIAQSMGWQAVAIALVPLAIGVPVGLLAGTRVFHLFADSIGTVNSATASSVVIAVIVAGTLVVALLATFATRGARRNSPAAVLRSE